MRLPKSSIARAFEAPMLPLPKAPRRDRASELGAPMDIKRVAQLIGCSPWTVRQTLMRRGLPFLRFTPNGRLIFFKEQVIGWIQDEQERRRNVVAGPTIVKT